jgi:N-acyl-D-amino-acid deacylase
VAYHTHRDGGRLVPAVMGAIGEPVPWCYGGLCLEAMDSSGGLIASVVDLVRFASAFDVPELCPLLGPDAVHMMFARPPDAAGYEHEGTPKAVYYACGWLVRPHPDGRADHWHTGMLEGSSTLLVRHHDGITWAALFNTDYAPCGQLLANLLDPVLHEAADAHELSQTQHG